jgi:hypothetical protein
VPRTVNKFENASGSGRGPNGTDDPNCG